MSEIYDRLQDVDKNDKAIGEALKKYGIVSHDLPPDEPPQPEVDTLVPDQKNGSGFSLAIFSLFVAMIVVVVVVVVFSGKTIDKVDSSAYRTEQLEVLLETQAEQLTVLQERTAAAEDEFRRAFKKDREQLAGLEKKIADLEAKLTADIKDTSAGVRAELREEFRPELLKIKTSMADQESRNVKVARDTDDLIKRFNNIQEEFNSLRVKLLEATVKKGE